MSGAPGYLPLLPAQQAIADRLAARWLAEGHDLAADLQRQRPETALRDGVLTEPMRHHAHINNTPQARFRPRQEVTP